jgi:hypothetical protein
LQPWEVGRLSYAQAGRPAVPPVLHCLWLTRNPAFHWFFVPGVRNWGKWSCERMPDFLKDRKEGQEWREGEGGLKARVEDCERSLALSIS